MNKKTTLLILNMKDAKIDELKKEFKFDSVISATYGLPIDGQLKMPAPYFMPQEFVNNVDNVYLYGKRNDISILAVAHQLFLAGKKVTVLEDKEPLHTYLKEVIL